MYSLENEKKYLQLAKIFLQQHEVKNDANYVAEISAILHYADWKYYVMDNPVLSDKEYDQLFSLLKNIENSFPHLKSENSPSQRVAMGLNPDFENVAHLVPMLSLDNSYNAQDLFDWHQRNIKLSAHNEIAYCVEPKFDGASISLIYHENQFYRAATRGNGLQGDDISANAKQIKTIPLQSNFAKNNIQQIEIRGEVVMNKKAFAEYNLQMLKEQKNLLANPRNAASGSLRLKNPKEVGDRKLTAFVYHISYLQGDSPFTNHYDALKYLQENGFKSSYSLAKVFNKIEDVIQYAQEFESKRDDLDYEIDGLVIKVNSFELQDKIGMTSHHPRWAMAYKFKARQASSKLLQIEYQVGRTGSITPVAKIEAVEVGGVQVSSISLFNEDVIQEKNLRIGDTILIERAGDVIPYIVKSFPELRNGDEQEIVFPSHCPVCKTKLEKPDDEAVWRCPNFYCVAQVVERMIHFASKDAMDIRGLGDSLIKRFFELGFLKNLDDIYHLPYDKIKSLEGFGEKSIEKLQAAIEKSKEQNLARIIFALGIRYVGETTAKTLARKVHHLYELKNYSLEDLKQLEDVGVKVAQSVFDYFNNEKNITQLQALENAGLGFSNEQKNNIGASLAGKSFLFTGTLMQLKRKEAEEMVEAHGGKIVSGVSSKLDYLVTGEAAGSKLEKAKKLGSVQIISEAEFLNLLE